MANISPFKGILYNTDKIKQLSDVVTPPFDVISEKERRHFHERHPHNIIRLILGEKSPAHTPHVNWQRHAADFYRKWLSEEVLIKDEKPSFYLTTLDFLLGEERKTRYGLIALVDLEPFHKKIIIPHEKTFSKIKSERLDLMKACRANFSPIFSLFLDSDNAIMDALKQSVSSQTDDIAFSDDLGHHHRLWRIADPKVHQYVAEKMREKRIYIADGHHRYETALNYREWISHASPDFSPAHPANRVMMYLSSMEDPGLTILSAHRVIKGMTSAILETFIEKCEPYFTITSMPFGSKNIQTALTGLMTALQAGSAKNSFGIYINKSSQFYLLTLKPGIMKEKFGNELHPALLDLDVIVLTRLILEEILQFDQIKLDNENFIDYVSGEKEAVERVISGKGDIVFLLNPTRIKQVQRIAEEGLTMPRKATYFYPKVTTGIVINSLAP